MKELYNTQDSETEVRIDGYVIDVVIGDLLIEIQTRQFSAIKDKLFKLMKNHKVRLVHPIAHEKWVVRQSENGEVIGRRKSPKMMGFLHIFDELVSIPTFIIHSNFELEVLLTREEEIRENDGKGSWKRKGWSSVDRRLVDIVDRMLFSTPKDFLRLLPDTLAEPFTTKALSEALKISRRLVQKMTYCMRKMEILKVVGKEGNAHLYMKNQ
ncbi:hypothetical protein E4H12_11605 [Candidatus Thorarchaeota archaeon]|nr:MAG: hypothetical protein E4H12_11605 [Candidatus Thorarchaeota archaeon]